jgi:FixJ family two-component response regulator
VRDPRYANARHFGFEVAALKESGREIPIIFLRPRHHPDVGARHQRRRVRISHQARRIYALIDAIDPHQLAENNAERNKEHYALKQRHMSPPREHEVLTLAISGMLNKQIAAELGVSEITVKVHRRRVMEKMQVRSVAELVRAVERLTKSQPAE